MKEIIEINNITKNYGDGMGVYNLSIKIEEKTVYGFIGPNGAGKSTTIKQMMGFIKPDKGEGKIDGFDIWSQSDLNKSEVGYLSGDNTLPEYMTGNEYFNLISKIRENIDQEYLKELINFFEIKTNIKIKKMSKGMKQKIGIIAAFMHKPKILILDEPTSGLDPLMQEKFQNLIRKVNEKGATIFMSSHDFNEISKLCDKVGFIKKGKMEFEEEIKKNDINSITYLENKFLELYKDEVEFNG